MFRTHAKCFLIRFTFAKHRREAPFRCTSNIKTLFIVPPLLDTTQNNYACRNMFQTAILVVSLVLYKVVV